MAFYNLSHLEQGSQEWKSWRKTVIGESDAPTVMRENPWSSPNHLMNEKLGRTAEFQGNAATREGQVLESYARKALEKESGLKLSPTIIQDEEHPFLAASLDAISKDFEHLFEIKCGKKSYEYVAANKEVPGYYFGQVQHMLMITGLSVMYLTVYRPDLKMLTLQVPLDVNYVNRLRREEISFAKELKNKGHKLQDKFHGKLIS